MYIEKCISPCIICRLVVQKTGIKKKKAKRPSHVSPGEQTFPESSKGNRSKAVALKVTSWALVPANKYSLVHHPGVIEYLAHWKPWLKK